MNLTEFSKNRIKERQQLLDKIIEAFKALNPYAIHQFGSGVTGFRDEFSDIDIWITFKDEETPGVLKNLNKIFRGIAPVLIRHHSKSWSPVGGSANSVIHDSKLGPLIVDYYISKQSETVMKPDSKIIFGNDSLPRGEWRLNKEVTKNTHDSHTLGKDTTLFINLLFSSIKVIIRDSDNGSFIDTLRTVHNKFRKRYNNVIKRRQVSLSFKSDYRLLSDFYKISNKKQRRAISKIRSYAKTVEALYK